MCIGWVWGRLGGRHRYNVYDGEQRQAVEVECTLDAGSLIAARAVARLIRNMVVRVVLQVSLRRMRRDVGGWGQHERR